MKSSLRRTSVLICALAVASGAAAQQPLSAIEWLEKQNSVPLAQPREPAKDEPPVTANAQTPGVQVTPLDEARPDSVGLLPTATTGLPASIWQASSSADLIARFNRAQPDALPASRALVYTLLLAEADAPFDTGNDADFLKARIGALVRFGAVDPALALIERAGPQNTQLFDIWLNLSLLTGTEDKPCTALRDQPSLSRDYAARIYCTARAGDWQTAALTYETAVALGALQGNVSQLLAQFLDPELIDEGPHLAPPKAPTPLVFRLYESVGAPLPTRGLPRAYAMADLRGMSGWKAELEAVERLARTGALPASRLLGLYTDRKPAASGGIWDRVRAVQRFDHALFDRTPQKVADTLPPAWQAALSEGLAMPFAQLFADALMEIDLPADSRRVAYEVVLLSEEYEQAPSRYPPQTRRDKLLAGIARGAPDPALSSGALQNAIVAGFSATGPADIHKPLLDQGKLGQALLEAAILLGRGDAGNETGVTQSIATLRAVGLEDTARRAALQILILRAPR